MEIRLGARTLLRDGAVIGRVGKVVLEPAKGAITHLVVLVEGTPQAARLVPVDQVAHSDEEEVHLAVDGAEFGALPEFDPDDFVPLEYGDWPGPYSVTALPIVAWGRPYPAEGLPLRLPEPPGELAYYAEWAPQRLPESPVVARGMRVHSFEGEPLGQVDRVLGDAETGKATYLVISGAPGAEGRLVPASWIRQVRDGDITLVVGAGVVRRLAAYPEPSRLPR